MSDEKYEVSVLDAFEDYKMWCQRRNLPVQATLQDFSAKMLAKFPTISRVRTTKGWVFKGVRLRAFDAEGG
jgi:hypothetical protein